MLSRLTVKLLGIASLALIWEMVAGAPAYSAEVNQVKLPPPKLLKTPTGVEVEVLFHGLGDIGANQKYTDVAENALFALVSIPAGIVTSLINPFAVFAPVYGVALIPAGYALKQRVEIVARALDPSSFSTAIVEAMWERIGAESDIRSGTRYSFAINSFGLTPGSDGAPEVFSSDREVCLFVKGILQIFTINGGKQEAPFNLTRSDRITRIPPPICQPFDRFTDDDGKLLRDALTETALIIGAWSALQRLHE